MANRANITLNGDSLKSGPTTVATHSRLSAQQVVVEDIAEVFACLPVCLSARIGLIRKPHHQTSPIFFVHIAYGSDLIQRHCNTLCTNSF